ncbi:MAG: hypothetical protein IPH23_13510 [Gammaproteobacteria bacterium]|nr:hypothetical protein [Gammaproteobacteria bacterium]
MAHATTTLKIAGAVAECSADALDQAITTTAARAGFAVDGHNLEIDGLCQQCQ